jgi:hypothetical protein
MDISSQILIISLFILVVWLILSTSTKQKSLVAEDEIQIAKEEEPSSVPLILYQLNTDPIRYQLYSTKHLRKDTQKLYSNIILDNLWINEPFHSTFFKFLLILEKDTYFIRDPFSKIITSNLRNDANQMVKVKSYLVLSVLEIIGYCISDCIGPIQQFRKHDAQNITFALMLLICQKSENILVTDLSEMKKFIFEDYPDAEKIEYILSLLEQHAEQFKFIPVVYDLAIKNVSRHPYVAGTAQPKLSINTLFLSKKVLKHCQ